MKIRKNSILTMSFLIFLISAMNISADILSPNRSVHPTFNRTKDLLLCQYDGKPDGDDVQSQAAAVCILMHKDFQDINSYGVMHAYGKQRSDILHESAEIFETIWGKNSSANDYTYWAQWHPRGNPYSDIAIDRVADVVKEILLEGGRVWIAEGGQSSFTYEWATKLSNDPQLVEYFDQNEGTFESRIYLLQHSHSGGYNEKHIRSNKLEWVQENLSYVQIQTGNRLDDGPFPTPGYKTQREGEPEGVALRAFAESEDNPNQKARALWLEADEVLEGWDSPNSSIITGGLDFSDTVEIWWILDMGNDIMDPYSFFDKFVINDPSDDAPPALKRWDMDNQTEFSASNIDYDLIDGVLIAKNSSTKPGDPRITLMENDTFFGIEATNATKLEFGLSLEGIPAGEQVNVKFRADGVWHNINLDAVIGAHVYEVDLSTVVDWQGNVDRIRLDFVEGLNSLYDIALDYVEISNSEPTAFMSWNMDEPTEVITRHIQANFSEGMLEATTTGNAPRVTLLDTAEASFPFAASNATKLQFRLFLDNSIPTNEELTIRFIADGSWKIITVDAVQGLHDYEVDLSTVADWQGTIERIRFDFVRGLSDPYSFQVDHITLLK